MFHKMNRAKMKPSALLAAITMICLLLSACGSQQPSASGSNNQQQQNGAAQSEEGTRKIKHVMGETDVPAHPKKVVILTNEGTEALLALGVKPIAAVDSYYGDPWYEHIASQMEGVKKYW